MRDNHISDYSSIIMFAAFLLGGVIHVVFWGVPYAADIVQIYYGVIMVMWLITLKVRMVDRHTRWILYGVAGVSLFFFFVQMGRYQLYHESIFLYRYAWYAYYIPMVCIPMLFFWLSLNMNTREQKKIPWGYKLVLVPGVMLILGFLTNDLHEFAFYPKIDVLTSVTGEYGYHWLYFVWMAYMVIVTVAASVIILRKYRLSFNWRQSMLTLFFVLAGTIGLIASIFNKVPKVFGIKIWQMPEIYVFMIACTLESLIQIGMIPSNQGYGKLFDALKMPVEIRDRAGNMILHSNEDFQADENSLVQTMDVDGGHISWIVDMAKVYELNKEMQEAMEQITSRNDYLKTKNYMEAEQIALESRNSLYTRIVDIVKGQLETIETLLADEENGDFTTRLSKISVLNAYVKRRSNMELLREGRENLPTGELKLAISESIEYLKLCHVDAIVSAGISCDLPAEMITRTYTFFEDVIENCLDSITALMVTLTANSTELTMRMLLQAKTLSLDVAASDPFEDIQNKVTVAKQGEDTLIVYTLRKGGMPR